MPRKRARRPKGMGQVLFRGGTWSIRWREGGRRRFKSGYPDQDTAMRALNRTLVDVAEGRKPDAPDRKSLPPLSTLATEWLERREKAGMIRSWRDDRSRWNAHLKKHFGACKPPDVDVAAIRKFVEAKLSEGLASTSVKHLVATLSNLYSDAIEQGYATTNPARALPRSLRRLMRPSHDPKTTPFIEKGEDVARLYRVLEQPWATLYVLTALAGLRPGEALALEWDDIDLAASRLLLRRQVRSGRVGAPKSGKPRVVPIIPALGKIVAEFKLATGGEGKLFPAQNAKKGGARGTPGKYLDPVVMQRKLGEALKACGIPVMTWYSAGRHTFASQHVLAGKSLAKLREILGHSSVVVTERYAHLAPHLFRDDDLMPFAHDLAREGGQLVDLAAHREGRNAIGHAPGTSDVDDSAQAGLTT